MFSNVSSVDIVTGPSNLTESFRSTRHLSLMEQILITFFYAFGISANICALVLLSRGETVRNRKQTLMVRCLACNDLGALVGSFLLMYMQLYMGEPMVSSQWFCVLRVILRTFGLSSGCVTIVMAAERWLALTRPFFYQKHVTPKLIKRAIFSLWIVALLLVCLPFTGFGLYYDVPSEKNARQCKCIRYRSATDPRDVAYAFVMFSCGVLLCLVIVCSNLAVVQALCKMGRKSNAHCGRTTVRKDSVSYNHTTPEELSFAKLMIVLCIFFVVCWVPQMITIMMVQVWPRKEYHPFYRIADVCMALNFTLDPVVYVLSRRAHRKGLKSLLKPFYQLCPQTERSSSLRSSQGMTQWHVSKNSKLTREVNQNSLSSGSQKECIVHDLQSGRQRPATKIVICNANTRIPNLSLRAKSPENESVQQ